MIEPATRPLPIASLPFRPPVAMTSLRLRLTASTELTTTAIFRAGFLSSLGDRMWATTCESSFAWVSASWAGSRAENSSIAESTSPVAAGGGVGRDCSIETVLNDEDAEDDGVAALVTQSVRGSLSTAPGMGDVS